MYADRIEAGMILANKLEKFRGQDAVILAIPRGGVLVAYPIAKQLQFPVDLLLIKKLGHPNQAEYAIGAVSLTGSIIATGEDIPEEYIKSATTSIRQRLREMSREFRGDKTPQRIRGRIVIIVDDGIATGRTLLAGIELIKKRRPAKIVVAAGVASLQAFDMLAGKVDEIICPVVSEHFFGVGAFYEDFSQTTDEEVTRYLSELSFD